MTRSRGTGNRPSCSEPCNSTCKYTRRDATVSHVASKGIAPESCSSPGLPDRIRRLKLGLARRHGSLSRLAIYINSHASLAGRVAGWMSCRRFRVHEVDQLQTKVARNCSVTLWVTDDAHHILILTCFVLYLSSQLWNGKSKLIGLCDFVYLQNVTSSPLRARGHCSLRRPIGKR